MLEDFAVFILSHGRPDNVITYKTIQRAGYTGRVFIIIDNEDKQADKYYQNFGDKVIVFDKAVWAEKTDTGDNFPERNTVLFARNAVFEIADNMGIEYFLVLDDDYSDFRYKINGDLERINMAWIKNANFVILSLLNFYKSIDCSALAIAQGGDFIGGVNSSTWDSPNRRRKAMNFWIQSVKMKYDYIGRMNDDVNTYVSLGNKGSLFLTFLLVAIQQKETQTNDGGLTDMYKKFGTYVKSFYTVMYQPSSVKCEIMRSHHEERLHHVINWDSTVPCILREEHRKVN